MHSGTITEHPTATDYEWAKYPKEDPRSWRSECDKTMLLSEFLDEWKYEYWHLHWIPYWAKQGRPEIYWHYESHNAENTPEMVCS